MPDQPADIVLIEDGAADVELALHALRQEHPQHRIQVLRDGEEALEFLFGRGAQRPPRLILLDLKLPKLDGLEVLREIKSDPRTRSIPVVALTCSKEEQDLVRCYQLGVNSYVEKPLDFRQFRETIQRLGYYWLVMNQVPLAQSEA